MEFNVDELDRIRQWYNAVKDLNKDYLGPEDNELYDKILNEIVNKIS